MTKIAGISGLASWSTMLLASESIPHVEPSGEYVWASIAAVLLGAVLGGVISSLSQRSRLERLENKLSALEVDTAVLKDREKEKRHEEHSTGRGGVE